MLTFRHAFGLVTAILIFIGMSNCGIGNEHPREYIIEGEIGENLDREFSPLVQNVIETHELPGLAIGVVVNNQIVYAKGFGFTNVDAQEPMSITTVFHMASISKPFVATALMQLVNQDEIQLDAPVTTYLPYFKLDGDGYRDITIQQMLSHVSGMPDVEDYEWNTPVYDEGALERYVRSLSSRSVLSTPGDKFAYSNMAFECLGDVIAKVSGISFADYEKEFVLNPSGMKESTFLKPEYLPENWASPHQRIIETFVWDGYPYNRMHGPSSTLHSNVLEMCNWAITNLNRGSFNGQQILSPASYDILWKPRVEISGGRAVGLSWFLEEYRGEKAVLHSGGDTGFSAYFIMLPERSTAVVVLCNHNPGPARRIAQSALDIVLGHEPGPVPPYANITVCKTLDERGLDAAVAHWDSLMTHHPDDYDFSLEQFYNLVTAVELERVNSAEKIARLCARIFPEPAVKYVEELVTGYQKRHPNNKAASVVLERIREATT
jgi:CubicO group peptidase (beta-lactamase class C family)